METKSQLLTSSKMVMDISNSIEDKLFLLKSASYEIGVLGYSLFYAYLAKYKKDPVYIEKAEEYFMKAMTTFDLKNYERVYATDSLDAQYAHIGRFLLFVDKYNLLSIDSNDYLVGLDEILFDLMKSKISIKDFDLVSGALASGVYFLSRQKQGTDVSGPLSFLIQSLDNFAYKDKDGDYFWKSPTLYDRVYLSISHGSCLMLSFLATAIELNVEVEKCKFILAKATKFVIKHYRKTKYKGLFPNKIGDKIEDMQFALCYGDVGTGYALLKAGIALEDDSIKTFAHMILEDCLKRTKEDNLTLDASIYYGASGVAISFDKIGHITKDKRYFDRARYWYNQIAHYCIHENEFAGFQSRLPKDEVIWNLTYGWGILGIGITLMYFDDESLPSFEELTMIS